MIKQDVISLSEHVEQSKSFEIDKEKFGAFVAQLRKEKGLTQKELAEQLYVSDKAVSKWECSLSLPDVTLLHPLADVLGVTVEELLACKRMHTAEPKGYLSAEEKAKREAQQKQWRGIFAAALAVMCGELAVLLLKGYTMQQMLTDYLLLFEILFAIFGGYFCFKAKAVLPVYYDQYKISSYADGFFRINIPVRISNRNWGAMMYTARIGITAAMLLLPVAYLAVGMMDDTLWQRLIPVITVAALLIAVGPMVIAAKKYE